MTDVHNKTTRSFNMSQIRGKDTKPEMVVRRFLHSQGYRYKLHDKNLPGKPDLVLPKYKTVIFVNGCFWHGHEGCKYFKIPKTNTQWWVEKISKTKDKDFEIYDSLKNLGFKIITVWECDLKTLNREKTLFKILEKIESPN